MTPELRVRGGIPRVAERLRAGEPVTIIAFGTSMTYDGAYLDALPATLRAASPNPENVRFLNRGLRGFCTFQAAFRVADRIVPESPDLVIIEFSHNDHGPAAVPNIPVALEGIMAQTRAAAPACEFAFVYLAMAGVAVAGPSPAARAYETYAERHGVAAIDCEAFVEGLVAQGEATWKGPERALTRDGIHYADLARSLIAPPFAAAFARLIDASRGPAAQATPAADALLAHTERRPARAFVAAGEFVTGVPLESDQRADAFADGEVLQNVSPDASLRIALEGRIAWMFVAGVGTIRIESEPAGERLEYACAGARVWISPTMFFSPTPHAAVLRVSVVNGTILFGDVFVAGRFTGQVA